MVYEEKEKEKKKNMYMRGGIHHNDADITLLNKLHYTRYLIRSPGVFIYLFSLLLFHFFFAGGNAFVRQSFYWYVLHHDRTWLGTNSKYTA
jgi:hypothetical protein